MRRIADFGYNPKWIGYEDGWDFLSGTIRDIAQVAFDLNRNKATLRYVDTVSGGWWAGGGYNVKVAKPEVEITGLVIRDNKFSGYYAFGKHRGEIKGEVRDTKSLDVRFRHNNADDPRWFQVMMSPADDNGDPVNTRIQPGDRCRMRMRTVNISFFKLAGYSGGRIEVEDLTQACRIDYSFMGAAVSAAVGSPVDFGEWSEWVEIYPRYVAPNLWGGMTMTQSNVIGVGNAVVITDNLNRNVIEVPIDSFGSMGVSVDLAGYGRTKLTREAELPLK